MITSSLQTREKRRLREEGKDTHSNKEISNTKHNRILVSRNLVFSCLL